MKFLVFIMYDVAKTAEMGAVGDKVANTPGINALAQYVCLGIPFPGVPPNTLVGVVIEEAESAEAIAAASYPVMMAGATVHRVPIMEVPVGGGAETERKYRG